MTGLQHPLVQEYLARLDQASAGLPTEIRAELTSDIGNHLASAVTPTSTDADVRNTLQELGAPEDVAAAAYADLADAGTPSGQAPPLAPPAAGPAYGASPYPAAPGYGQPVPAPSQWGPVEIIAVVGLTAGNFIVPVVGPIIGLVMAWVSDKWTKREKVIATVLCVLPVLAIAIGGIGLIAFSTGNNGSVSNQGTVVYDPASGANP